MRARRQVAPHVIERDAAAADRIKLDAMRQLDPHRAVGLAVYLDRTDHRPRPELHDRTFGAARAVGTDGGRAGTRAGNDQAVEVQAGFDPELDIAADRRVVARSGG